MRHFISSSFITAAAVVLMAGSASATSMSLSLTNITGLSSGDINALEVGDSFEVAITLDNSSGDDMFSVFTFLNYDSSVIDITAGFADGSSFPTEPGFGTGNSLVVLGAPEQAAGQPAGVAVGLALGVSNPTTGDGLYSATNSGIVAIAIFTVVGLGDASVAHVDTGNTDIRTGTTDFGSPLSIQTVPVPEPGTALLMGLGLGGLAFSGRRRA